MHNAARGHDVQQGSHYEVSSSGPVLVANEIHSHATR
jgi:hypothetical protein